MVSKARFSVRDANPARNGHIELAVMGELGDFPRDPPGSGLIYATTFATGSCRSSPSLQVVSDRDIIGFAGSGGKRNPTSRRQPGLRGGLSIETQRFCRLAVFAEYPGSSSPAVNTVPQAVGSETDSGAGDAGASSLGQIPAACSAG